MFAYVSLYIYIFVIAVQYNYFENITMHITTYDYNNMASVVSVQGSQGGVYDLLSLGQLVG